MLSSIFRSAGGAARPVAALGRARLSSAATPVETAVMRLCEEHGAPASSQMALDNLPTKFKVRNQRLPKRCVPAAGLSSALIDPRPAHAAALRVRAPLRVRHAEP